MQGKNSSQVQCQQHQLLSNVNKLHPSFSDKKSKKPKNEAFHNCITKIISQNFRKTRFSIYQSSCKLILRSVFRLAYDDKE